MEEIEKCPNCGYELSFRCDFTGCCQPAAYEAWFGSGLMQYMRACKEHARHSRAYKKYGEKAFAEAL